MSFERLNYDACSYEQKLKESIGPGMYQLGSPANDCTACSQDVPSDPYMRWQSWGPGFCSPGSTVDTSSELLGITRKASKCSSEQYLPGQAAPPGQCVARGRTGPECAVQTEPTRVSNPPCTLKGTGNNRWEWLCWNPQDRAIIPFEWNVSNRIVVKDNHAPCLPQPLDQTAALPKATAGAAPPAYPTRQEALPAQQTGISCKAIGTM